MIYIDASRANRTHRTGVAWYCYRFIEALGRVLPNSVEVTLLLDAPRLPDFPQIPKHWHIEIVTWRLPFWSLFGLSIFFAQRGFSKKDVMWSPGSVPPLYAPKCIATVHDLGFLDVPQFYSFRERIIQRLGWLVTKIRAYVIITPSHFTALRVRAYFSRTVVAIYNAPGILAQSDSKPPHTHYFLYVGRLEHKKNILGLIKGFEAYRSQGGTHQLVLIGGNGFGAEKIHAMIEKSSAQDFIITLGSQSEIVVAQYMKHATALVLYSWYEGFGMPLIESLSVGAPVIASDIPVHREILLDCGYFVDPNSPQALGDTFKKVTEHVPTDHEKTQLYQQAAHYSWDQSATELSAILQKMVE